ncbi:hypothetical protein SDC9_177738 [bioreactor metagenome]|uniref:Uncharacterized protein n=1 Tax=bioreactor metagenome TaxID=1076179 RepID=A0A645GU30_9ZZZZ
MPTAGQLPVVKLPPVENSDSNPPILGQQAVIKTLTPPQPIAPAIERHAGNQPQPVRLRPHRRQTQVRLHQAVTARRQIPVRIRHPDRLIFTARRDKPRQRQYFAAFQRRFQHRRQTGLGPVRTVSDHPGRPLKLRQRQNPRRNRPVQQQPLVRGNRPPPRQILLPQHLLLVPARFFRHGHRTASFVPAACRRIRSKYSIRSLILAS